jgi:hypothetical protein
VLGETPEEPPPVIVLGTGVAVGTDFVVGGAPLASTDISAAGAAYVFKLRRANGEPCASDIECASDFCVEEVCCNSDCGRNDENPCSACSAARGATVDGACTFFDDNSPCSDGVFCNGPDTCLDGQCVLHAGYPCPGRHDGDGDCRESCSEERGDCPGSASSILAGPATRLTSVSAISA